MHQRVSLMPNLQALELGECSSELALHLDPAAQWLRTVKSLHVTVLAYERPLQVGVYVRCMLEWAASADVCTLVLEPPTMGDESDVQSMLCDFNERFAGSKHFAMI